MIYCFKIEIINLKFLLRIICSIACIICCCCYELNLYFFDPFYNYFFSQIVSNYWLKAAKLKVFGASYQVLQSCNLALLLPLAKGRHCSVFVSCLLCLQCNFKQIFFFGGGLAIFVGKGASRQLRSLMENTVLF